MAIHYLSLFITLAIVLAPGIQALQMAYGNYGIHPPSEDVKNNSSSSGSMARPPPKYTCVSILGVCNVTLSEARCYQLCYNYYSGLNPYPRCERFPGIPDVFCYCEHDCSNPPKP